MSTVKGGDGDTVLHLGSVNLQCSDAYVNTLYPIRLAAGLVRIVLVLPRLGLKSTL